MEIKEMNERQFLKRMKLILRNERKFQKNRVKFNHRHIPQPQVLLSAFPHRISTSHRLDLT